MSKSIIVLKLRELEYQQVPGQYKKRKTQVISAENHVHMYTTSQKFLNSKILMFLKKSLLLTKPAFI